ncbi:hypothetical protein BpHYR1_027767 [Brachionus plicatilis]|uniref:Uncharacterized protein n=1 Tax=Brachionus plicatilis TaxID=10195 RepID=A0A3M7PQ32_BRAPC|nr:hypothetical protein BpHYR1_027767 [Brachionus plicatilis]
MVDDSLARASDLSIPLLINPELNETNLIKCDQISTNQYNSNDANKPVVFSLNSLTNFSSNQSSNFFSTSLPNTQTNLEMDWNDPEILQICQELNSGQNYMQENQTNSNLNQNYVLQPNHQSQFVSHSRPNDPLIDTGDVNYLSWDILEPDYNQLMNGYLQSPTI